MAKLRNKIAALVVVVLFILLLLFLLFVIIIRQPWAQKIAVNQATNYLENKLGTKVDLEAVHVDIWNNIHLKNILIEDQVADTLLYAAELEINLNELGLISGVVDIQDISLQGAYINIYRPNEQLGFNYAFIAENLGSGNKQEESSEPEAESKQEPADTSKVKESKEFPVKLSLAKLALSGTTVLYKDDVDGLALGIDLPLLDVLIEDFDIDRKLLSIQDLYVIEPDIATRIYAGQKKEKKPEKKKKKEPKPLNPTGWTFKAEVLAIEAGHYTLDLGHEPRRAEGFDTKHIDLTSLYLDLWDFHFAGDSLGTDLPHLAFDEASGFQLSQFQSQLALTSKLLSLQGMHICTPNSEIGQSFELKYKSFADFKDFNNKVRMKMDLGDGFFRLKDAAYFAPKMKQQKILASQLNEVIKVGGRVKGKVKSLRGEDISLAFGRYTYFDGDFRLTGLPNFDRTFFDLDVNRMRTHAGDIARVTGDLKLPDNFSKLGEMNFRGRLTGSPVDFVTDGAIQTAIGNLEADLNLKVKDTPVYRGDLAVQDFNMREWLGDDRFGVLSAQGKVDGRGFKLDDLRLDVDGSIDQFHFNGYDYRDVVLDGEIEQRLFKGELAIEDEHLAMDFTGLVDLSQEVPVFKFESKIDRADLKALKLVKDDLSITAIADLSLEGSDIDDFDGEAFLKDIVVEFKGKTIAMDSLVAISETDGSSKDIVLQSPIVGASFKGDFSFKKLSPTFKDYLSTYFPYRWGDIWGADEQASNEAQQIEFDVELYEDVADLEEFIPKMQHLPTGSLKGTFNSMSKKLKLDAEFDSIVYDGFMVDSIRLATDSDIDALEFKLDVGEFVKDDIAVPELALDGRLFDDSLRFYLKAHTDTSLNRLRLGGLLFTNADTLKMNVESTDLYVDGKRWEASTGNLSFYDKENFSIEDLRLVQDDQSITLNSKPSRNYKNYSELYLDNFDLGAVSEMIGDRKWKFRGRADGNFAAKNIFNEPKFSSDLKIKEFVFNEEVVGDVQISARKKHDEDKVIIQSRINNDEYNLDARGFYELPDKSDPKKKDGFVDLDLDVRAFQLAFLETVIGDMISNTTGSGKGLLNISGPPNDLGFYGELMVKDAGSTIDYLNVHYTFEEGPVTVQNKIINLNNIKVHDRFDNTAFFDGYLDLNDFKDISLEAQAISENFLFVETGPQDNELFYGTVFGKGTVDFYGPFDDFTIDIAAQSMPGTHVSIPISDDDYLGEDNFYRFINTGVDTLEVEEKLGFSFDNLQLNFIFEMTPDALVEMILDPLTKDIIRGRGTGNIQMNYSTLLGEFNMHGDYTVTEGDYQFTMQNIFTKQFDIKPGGTIRFAGDPYNAQLNIDAIYNLKASRFDIIKEVLESGQENEAKRRVPVDVNLNMQGSLASPDIDFRINFPERGVTAVDNLAQRRIDDINTRGINELNKQVFGLLVLNKFLSYESISLAESSNDLLAGVNTTVSEFVSTQFSSYLDDVVSSVIPDSDLNFIWRNYSLEDAEEPALRDNRNEVNVVFTKRFLDDRISIDIGTDFDVGGAESSAEQNIAIAGDFIISYKITRDGKYRIKLFSVSERDIFSDRYNKTGASVAVTEEFDTLGEFFGQVLKRGPDKN